MTDNNFYETLKDYWLIEVNGTIISKFILCKEWCLVNNEPISKEVFLKMKDAYLLNIDEYTREVEVYTKNKIKEIYTHPTRIASIMKFSDFVNPIDSNNDNEETESNIIYS